jgi:hypothetical protein
MNKTVTRGQISRLDLMYPPISNQEAVWLERDPEVQEELRASNFYMIAGRPEAKFLNKFWVSPLPLLAAIRPAFLGPAPHTPTGRQKCAEYRQGIHRTMGQRQAAHDPF